MTSAQMTFLFVMDPITAIHVAKDTSLVMMVEAQRRGHLVSYAEMAGLHLRGGVPYATCHPARVSLTVGSHYALGPAVDAPLGDFDVVCMRKDPPVDTAYVHATRLFDMAPPSTLFVNRPQSLRDCNEKLFALQFPDLVPPSVVTQRPALVTSFCEAQGGKVVLKPLDGFGGEGIFLLDLADPNRQSILETMTDFGRRPVLAQRYLPAVHESGDQRILVVAGVPVGAVRRLPARTDFRSNVHSGGRVVAGEVGPRERAICDRLRPELLRRGLLFVGLDVIDGFLTEINVTSPTLVQEHTALTGEHTEVAILDAIEAAHRAPRA